MKLVPGDSIMQYSGPCSLAFPPFVNPQPQVRALLILLIILASHQIVLNQLDHSDSLAERFKALAQGASPQGRGFEPHSCHFVGFTITILVTVLLSCFQFERLKFKYSNVAECVVSRSPHVMQRS